MSRNNEQDKQHHDLSCVYTPDVCCRFGEGGGGVICEPVRTRRGSLHVNPCPLNSPVSFVDLSSLLKEGHMRTDDNVCLP